MSSSLIVNVVWDSSENQKLVSIQSPFKSLKMPMLTKAENYLLSKFSVYSHKSKNDSKWTWGVLLNMKKSLIQVSEIFLYDAGQTNIGVIWYDCEISNRIYCSST